MQDKKLDVSVSEDSNLVTVTTPEYVKESIKEAIAEHAASRNHPYATQVEPGLVTLSNETDSDSEITAATSKAVKKAYDLANTANQNALNNNSDLYLEKKQNGADIPDKAEFVKNIGLAGTIKRAGDIYLSAHPELNPGEYFANGDLVDLNSLAGQKLMTLSDEYRRTWGIIVSGLKINLPNLFHSDGRGFYLRADNIAGKVIEDRIRNIIGTMANVFTNAPTVYDGALNYYGNANVDVGYGLSQNWLRNVMFDASKSVPTGPENNPLTITMRPVIFLGV
ncbi:phage tail protein [Xenorhabdus griffiniae]|uniref:phage tail protein n=1 Tax=Xenorhabdus griffiniae TaxID=351672 RepID=UPI0030CB9FE2